VTDVMAALRPGPPVPPPGRPADLTASAVGAPPGPRVAALPTGAHPPRPSVGRRLLRDAREVLGTVAIALGIAIVIKTFLIQPFYIPSQSMEDTLLVGDRVLVSKLEPGPFELDRGDVAVFVDPGGWLTTETPEPSLVNRALTFVGLLPANSGEHLIKRVIGLPGDTVKCCDAEGRLLVNNQPLDESQYLFPGDSPSSLEFEVVVPDGTVWVMGDHRSVSEDSRYHDVDGDFTAGAVPIDNVVGRAVLVMWPLSRLDWLGTPDGVFDGVGGQLDGVR
jgi:signal peptidase I